MSNSELLKVEDLSVAFVSNNKETKVIHNISYSIKTNEVVGIVGESGSGKSVSSLAIMGLLPKQISKISSGAIIYQSSDLLEYTSKAMQSVRSNEIAMIFQEPMSSLNPSMTCGLQVSELIYQHTQMSRKDVKAYVIELFENVKLPEPERIYKAYPHEISGGQKQRVMIAMAIACKPKLLIADEPTTALDVTVQKEIINLLKEIQAETKMSIIFISHDLALVSEIADRVIVMYKGNIVEAGKAEQVFLSPKHNYTKALINSRPSLEHRLKYLPTVKDFINNTIDTSVISKAERSAYQKKMYANPPLLEVINVEKTYYSQAKWFSKPTVFKAVNDVSFKIYEGETLGLVGESGCGKSTLGNAILQLDKATSGTIKYKGKVISAIEGSDLRALRKDIQIIFQDPYASLNPRLTIAEAILEPMRVHQIGASEAERQERLNLIIENVGLSLDMMNRYPHEFSGGQRQRIGIARTIALDPKLIVCDESVSALDISVQAQVLNLLNDLKTKFGFTYIFISHDLAVVKYMADQLLVMKDGKIEEMGDADDVYNNPTKAYTKKLIHAIPKGL